MNWATRWPVLGSWLNVDGLKIQLSSPASGRAAVINVATASASGSAAERTDCCFIGGLTLLPLSIGGLHDVDRKPHPASMIITQKYQGQIACPIRRRPRLFADADGQDAHRTGPARDAAWRKDVATRRAAAAQLAAAQLYCPQLPSWQWCAGPLPSRRLPAGPLPAAQFGRRCYSRTTRSGGSSML